MNLIRQRRSFFGQIVSSCLLAAILLIFSNSASAQANNSSYAVRSEVQLTETFQEIEVKGDVTVILTNEPAGQVLLEGSARELGCVKISVNKGKLVIDTEFRKCASKLTVFVSIANVHAMFLSGEPAVFTSGKVKTCDLRIFMTGGSSRP